jgi:hypothetical protein
MAYTVHEVKNKQDNEKDTKKYQFEVPKSTHSDTKDSDHFYRTVIMVIFAMVIILIVIAFGLRGALLGSI